jgi:hypothetical protein
MHSDIPAPVLFNPLKHHTGFINEFVDYCRTGELGKKAFKDQLLKVGTCMIDIYHGELGVQDIVLNVEAKLKAEGSYHFDAYMNFISRSGKNYELIRLDDGSTWTMLPGNDKNRWIHIHPARGSLNTIRASAMALKTAITLKAWYPEELSERSLVELTNNARREYLDESPIKDTGDTRSLQKVLVYL